MKREFLMLSHKYESAKCLPCGWYASEKLDGVRAFWDGGITTGLPAIQVPWANVEKHDRFKEQVFATGLWTRYGQVIRAPNWFILQLPRIALDGELWAGRGQFQETVGIVKSHESPDWSWIKYMVFDSPSLGVVFSDGQIKGVNYTKTFRDIAQWIVNLGIVEPQGIERGCEHFYKTYQNLYGLLGGVAQLHNQQLLPSTKEACQAKLDSMLEDVVSNGGEGLMLRNPVSRWEPCRSHKLLKVKPWNDMEGTVVGYRWGEKTELGSKLLGLMGSLRLKLNSGVQFDLSGFTDRERSMRAAFACDDPIGAARLCGERDAGLPVNHVNYFNPMFPIGARVTFQYRELTDAGIPKEARYYRKAD